MEDREGCREGRPLIVLTGPTAVGKTNLSIRLAKALGGEIISADSMQVYRHMDIGSAKVSPQEMDGVPHHLIDVLEPWEGFDVARFKEMAVQALQSIYRRRRIPIVAGGTGFYIQALLYDIDFSEEAGHPAIRAGLEAMMEAQGPEAMHRLLAQVDPASSGVIHPNNRKRVIRALEYYQQTGRPISLHNEQERRKESPYQFLYYVLTTDRTSLYRRIERRVDQMVEAGLVQEVQALKELGCTPGMVSMQGLGYKEILRYLDGECTLLEALDVLKRDTRHFAKRQLTWFRRERDVKWLELSDYQDDSGLVLSHILEEVRAHPAMGPYLHMEGPHTT